MKPRDFDDIYDRYLAIPAVHKWLNLKEPVKRLGEYLRVEDPMLLGIGLPKPSERGVKSPDVGDLYLVHSIQNGFALGITLAQQVKNYELIASAQSVLKVKRPNELRNYSDRIVVRRFAVDLERISKSLELLEFSWMDDGGLVTQARFTVVRQFPFPMTSHAEHRFFVPPDNPYDMPSEVYAKMVLREMSVPRCDARAIDMATPCKFCMVYGRKTCQCPTTFRKRLGHEKQSIKSVKVLTQGTWSGYKSVFERAQLTGQISVRWLLENSQTGLTEEVISATLPYRCRVGGPLEIHGLIRKFCVWTNQYAESPNADSRYLIAAPTVEAQPCASMLTPFSVTNVVDTGDGEDQIDCSRAVERYGRQAPAMLRVAPAQTPSVYKSAVSSVRTLRSDVPDDSLSFAKDYSIAQQPRQSITFTTSLLDSRSHANLISTSTYTGDNVSIRSSISRRSAGTSSNTPSYRGGVVKRNRPISPTPSIRLSPVTVSPNQSCGTMSAEAEGAARLLEMQSRGMHRSGHFPKKATSTISTSQHGSASGYTAAVGLGPRRTIPPSLSRAVMEDVSMPNDMPEPIPSLDADGKQINWICPLCHQTFKGKRGNLNRHYQVVHEKERRFVCEYPGCGQRFGYRLNQQRHYQNVHQSRKFKCDQCSEAFKTAEKLDIHVKVDHEKLEKPYICPICPNAAFGRKSSLTRHMGNQHPGQGSLRGRSRVVNTGTPPLRVHVA